MKLIFLDIDGVLNSTRFFRARDALDALKDADALKGALKGTEVIAKWDIDEEAVSRLNCLIEATDARIVITSIWRHMGLDLIRKILQKKGLEAYVWSQTPMLGDSRGHEIQSWLQRRRDTVKVESFVILDDDADMEQFLPRLVQTTMAEGLQDEHVERAIELLNGPPKGDPEKLQTSLLKAVAGATTRRT
jgi:hypothetical protein